MAPWHGFASLDKLEGPPRKARDEPQAKRYLGRLVVRRRVRTQRVHWPDKRAVPTTARSLPCSLTPNGQLVALLEQSIESAGPTFVTLEIPKPCGKLQPANTKARISRGILAD